MVHVHVYAIDVVCSYIIQYNRQNIMVGSHEKVLWVSIKTLTVHALLCCYCVPFSVLLGPDRRFGACVTVGLATAGLLSLISVFVTKP